MTGLAWIACLAFAVPTGDDEREMAVERHAEALLALGETRGTPPLIRFLDAHVTAAYRKDATDEELLARLDGWRRAARSAGAIRVHPVPEGLDVHLSDERNAHVVQLRTAAEAPFRIVRLTLETGPRPPEAPAGPPLTWETLEARLEEAVADGFAGTVRVVRHGDVVLHRGFGLANERQQAANHEGTLFAIGSVPIDFTKAAILKLEDLGRLKTTDHLSAHLPNVPEDKKSITLDHLMTGRSGLHNFHHVREEDDDFDLTWIDRATALRRILGRELLFEPGTDSVHSHSAWSVLAAVIEVVSGQSYDTFLTEHFFEPAGMDSTGFYSKTAEFPEEDIAAGRNGRGTENPGPATWGRTSWLVLGSGGMVSNPRDLAAWMDGLRDGLLSRRALAKYWSPPGQVLAGDNDRGFLCAYTEHAECGFILCSNTHRFDDCPAERMTRLLVDLTSR